nr:hypothetical protein [Tanacetum cinerariifolium]
YIPIAQNLRSRGGNARRLQDMPEALVTLSQAQGLQSGERRDIYWMSYLVWYYPTTIPDSTLSMTPPSTHIDTTPIPIVSSTIPPSSDNTPASLDYSPASDMESDPSEDSSSDHIPPLPAILPFLSSTDDSSDNDIPDTPPSPTHGTPFTETTLSTQRSPATSGSFDVESLFLHLGSLFLMVNHHFASDDSSRDSSSGTSSDPSSDDLSDYSLPAPSSGMRPSHHLCSLVSIIPRSFTAIIDRPSHVSSSASPSRKRSRSPVAFVPLSSHILGALSYARADLLPSPKRIKSSDNVTDLEDSSMERFELSWSRETELEMDVDIVRSDVINIDPEILAEIDECITYVDTLRDRGIDAKVIVEVVDRDEIEMGARGPIEVRVDRVTHPVIADDIPEPAQEDGVIEVTYETLGDLGQRFYDHTVDIPVHRVQIIEGIQRYQGHRIIATGKQSTDMLESIRDLERVNKRLRDMMDVANGLPIGRLFTNALPADRFNYLVHHLGISDGVATSFQLSQDSRPHAHDHRDEFMMKAQVNVSKSSAISDVQALSQKNIIDKITHVVPELRMEFKYKDRKVALRRTKKLALHWVKRDKSTSIPIPIANVLSCFEDVFVVPIALPPMRDFDHEIVLKNNTEPIFNRPYRHPPTQKDAIEGMVKDLMESGDIRPNQILFKLDLRSGYHQIRMCQYGVEKTAFKTHEGHYEFQSHVNHLELVLQLLRAHTLFAKQSKYVFGAKKVKYLSHVITGAGVATDESKIMAMKQWPSEDAQSAFLNLKEAMVNALVFKLPNFDEPFVVETHASGEGGQLLQLGLSAISTYLLPKICNGLKCYNRNERIIELN